MNIVARRGRKSNTIFLVKHNEEYYLVNLAKRIYARSKYPDKFLRFGYFYPVKKVKAEIAEKVWSVLLEGRDVTSRRSG